jgi:OOP family OmpA-OmpF porin
MAEFDDNAHGCRTGFFASLGLWALAALITLLGAHGCTPRMVEQRLQERVERALASAGHNSVTAEMDGQRVILSGVAPSDREKQAAARVAHTAAGAGGPWAGGVTAVANTITVGKPVSPYTWSAVRTADGVRLQGHAPTAKVRAALSAKAKTLFRGKIVDEITVAAGAPAGGDWEAIAVDALDQLSRLTRGEVRMSDNTLVIMGEAPRTAAEQVRARYAKGVAPPYQALVDVLAPGEGLGIPELANINLVDAQAQDCQRAFAALLQRNVINFETGSAVVQFSSQQLLDNLAAIARRCDRYTIAIAGHTDNTGDRAMNMELSKTRAQTVLAYLVGRGVSAQRMTAEGFGPDRPVAVNRTEAGRAANRRIEFTVSS